MSTRTLPIGPDPEAIIRTILATWPETDMVSIDGASFFSLDPEKHWPNYATIVWADNFDQSTNLTEPGVFRLNLGVSRPTFQRIAKAAPDPDYTAFDRLFPHPVYGKQLWISVLNPSDATFQDLVLPLMTEAHDRLAAQRARHARKA